MHVLRTLVKFVYLVSIKTFSSKLFDNETNSFSTFLFAFILRISIILTALTFPGYGLSIMYTLLFLFDVSRFWPLLHFLRTRVEGHFSFINLSERILWCEWIGNSLRPFGNVWREKKASSSQNRGFSGISSHLMNMEINVVNWSGNVVR